MCKKWMVIISFLSFTTDITVASEEVFKIEDEPSITQGSVRGWSSDQDLNVSSNLIKLKDERRNSILQENLRVVFLPNELIIKIASYMDDQSLLDFSKTFSQGFSFAEESFKERSAIKLPLSCLVDFETKHPYPFMVSYFIRKYLGKTLTANSISPKFYRSLSTFSERWNYVGKTLFDQLAINKDWIIDRSSVYESLSQRLGNRDSKEIKLYLQIFHYLLSMKDSSYFKHTPNNRLNDIISTAKYMSIRERKEIASFYINYLGNYFLNEGYWAEACCCYTFCAEQRDVEAQYKLGSIFYEVGQVEKAQKYLRLSADQGYRKAQYRLASIFYSKKNEIEKRKYLKLAAAQGHKEAQFYLGIVLEKENISEAQKYYQLAASQGHKGAQELLQNRKTDFSVWTKI